MTVHRSRTALEAGLRWVAQAPPATGRLELIVRRPAEDERELLPKGHLDLDVGLVGDRWGEAASLATGSDDADPDAQVTIMNARAVALAAGPDRRGWAEAGDQLYVDLDISERNLPAGTRLQIGAAVLEITAAPHLGCGKFARRFGVEALKFFNSKTGRELRLRGANSRVIQSGPIAVGDEVRKLPPDA